MKKYVSILAFVLLGICPAFADGTEYVSDQSQVVKKTVTYNVKPKASRHSKYKIVNNFYVQQQPSMCGCVSCNSGCNSNVETSAVVKPEKKSYYFDRQYSEKQPVERKSYVKHAEDKRSDGIRKFFLAHPFYQPLEGKFGSVTDISYTQNNFNITLNQTVADIGGYTKLDGLGAKWTTSQFAIKEDFSFGVTDQLAFIVMAQYDLTSNKVGDWSDGSPEDEYETSGLNLYGAGLQYRFVDSDNWVASFSGYYQRQKDTANILLGDVRAGFKVSSTTVYGFGRYWHFGLDGNAYGAFMEDENKTQMFLGYKVNIDKISYTEGGLGIFSVLNKDWTLNLEGIYGNYDWHNQANIKGAIGWQPNDNFALNLYGTVNVYDSAKNETIGLYWNEEGFTNGELINIGTATISSYKEWKLGAQFMFTF